MLEHIRKVLLLTLVGASGVWIGSSFFVDHESAVEADLDDENTTSSTHGERSSIVPSRTSATLGDQGERSSRDLEQGDTTADPATIVHAASVGSVESVDGQAEDSESPWTPSENSPVDSRSDTFRGYEKSPGSPPELMNSANITCEFGSGNSGSVLAPPVGSAEWQGGPIIYHSINVDTGTARMSGTIGATGSQTGETDVRVGATANALHFYGLSPIGNFVVVSIFNIRNNSGDYAAIMSRHNERPMGLHTSVFSGACY